MIGRFLDAIRGTSLIVRLIGAFAVVAIIVAAGLFAARHTVEASFWHDGKGKRHGEGYDYDRAGKHGRDTHSVSLNGMKSASDMVISETRIMHHGGVKSVRYAVGTAQNVDAVAGTFDLILKDGSGTLSFTIDDNTKVFINGVEGMSGLGADALVTVVETRDLDGWMTQLGRGFGLFSRDGTVRSEARYLSDDGVTSVVRVVGTPQNINAGAGTFELLLLDGSAVMAFEIGSDFEALILGLNAEETITVVQTAGADGSTDLQIAAHSRATGRSGGFSGRFDSDRGGSHGDNSTRERHSSRGAH